VKTVILVPRREGFEDRDALWRWCRPWWQWRFPDWPLVEGHHVTGLFNRSAAINTAAELAGDWDVAVVIDADVIIDPPNVVEAVRQAHESGRMTMPFETRRDLNARGTQLVMSGYEGDWKRYVRRTYEHQTSSVVVVPRRLWDDIGGFDEGFRGWGLEDTAFAIAAETLTGQPIARGIPGDAWHLFHRTAPEKHGSWPHARNVARANRYRAAQVLGDLDAIRALVAEGRESAQLRSYDTIPSILHRVVPEQTPAIAETWWEGFRDLHPGWRLMTHRDPLDPADWPITSPHWDKVESGAQLADLVRLEALYKWGGFYVDQDVEPFRPLDPLLGAEVVAAWEDEKVVPNAVMGARADHPVIRACLEEAIRVIRKGTWETGPGVTTRILAKAPQTLLLPPGSFYPVHYRDPDRDALMVAPAPPWAFVRHAYWGSWLEESRRRVPVEAVAA
jgi:hypothetical protein